MNEQTNETIKPKRYRRIPAKKPTVVEAPVITDAELDAYIKRMIKQTEDPLHKKIWDGFVAILAFIVQAFALIIGFIIGLGGCLLEFLWIGIAFLLGWWLLSGLWNWIF